MATVPTLLVEGIDQTDYIQDKTLNWKRNTLDFTLVDPASLPAVHDVVYLDTPAWHGRVTTTESYPFTTANGDEHHYVKITATNKLVPVTASAPFDLSDTPNHTTTFPYKDLSVIRTLNVDSGDTELRLTGIVYEPGLIPGMTIDVTCDVEGLSAQTVYVVEVSANWLRSDSPEYHLDLSKDNVPKIDLPSVINNLACDCPPFVDCTPPSLLVPSLGGADVLAAVIPGHGNGLSVESTDSMIVYRGATYGIDYLVFHNVASNNLNATLADYYGGQLGVPGATPGTSISAPAVNMGDAGRWCQLDPTPDDIPIGEVDWTVPAGTGDTMRITAYLYEAACVAGDAYASSISAHVTYISGPDPRFETLPGCDHYPHAGQPIYPTPTESDGTTTDFTLDWPYMPDALFVLVDGIDWTDQVSQTNPETGDYALAYAPPTDAVITVRYRYPKAA